jgi:hypothetical protein
VRELNDALLLLTIEGLPGNLEVHAWLSTFCLQLSQVEDFHKKWEQRLHKIFLNE